MRFLASVSLGLVFLLQPAFGEGEVGNWYFRFFEGETEMAAAIYSPDGKEVDRITGTVTGKSDVKLGLCEMISVVSLEVSKQKVKTVATYRYLGAGKIVGKVSDQSGGISKMTVELHPGDLFRGVIVNPKDITITIEGRLIDDSRIETTQKVTSPDGRTIATLRTIYSKATAKAGKVEQSAATKPKPAEELKSEGS